MVFFLQWDYTHLRWRYQEEGVEEMVGKRCSKRPKVVDASGKEDDEEGCPPERRTLRMRLMNLL